MVGMYRHLDAADAPSVDADDVEGVVFILQVLVHAGEVALDLQQQAGQRVGLARHLLKLVVIDVEDLAEVAQQRLALETVSVVVELDILALLLVILVVDLADNLLQDVLQRDQSARAAILIDDDGHVDVVLLEVAQEVVDHLGLGHEVGRTDETLPAKALGLGEMGQQVLDIEDATDVVLVVLIDGDARIVVVNDTLEHVLVAAVDWEIDDILARGHDLLGRFVAEADDALEHALLVLDIVLVGELQRLLQLIDRELAALLLDHALGEGAAADEDRLQGPEDLAQEQDAIDGEAAVAQGSLAAEDLGHDLAEEQEEEGEQDGDAEHLEPSGLEGDEPAKEIVEQHDDHHVDEVVGYQDGSQCALVVVAEHLDALVLGATVGIKGIDIVGGKTKEGYLRPAGKGREQEHEDSQESRQPRPEGDYVDINEAGGIEYL